MVAVREVEVAVRAVEVARTVRAVKSVGIVAVRDVDVGRTVRVVSVQPSGAVYISCCQCISL